MKLDKHYRNDPLTGVRPVIGNGSMIYAKTREAPTHSFHVESRKPGERRKERAIRMDREFALDCAAEIQLREGSIATVTKRPIFFQEKR